MAEVIDRFKGIYEFMSNFSSYPVLYRGVRYRTSEHAFQAAKAVSQEDHDWVASAASPLSAKHRGGKKGENGRTVEIRPDWDEVKDLIMLGIVYLKFAQNKGLADKLLATEDADLIEGNNWYDYYWGMVKDENGEWQGQNRLGRILMLVRGIIRLQRAKGL